MCAHCSRIQTGERTYKIKDQSVNMLDSSAALHPNALFKEEGDYSSDFQVSVLH